MKGKNLFKKIVASALTLAIVFSNVSVAAQDQSGEIQTQSQEEEIQPQTEDTTSVEERTAPETSQDETPSDTASPEEDQAPAPSEGEDATAAEPGAPEQPSDTTEPGEETADPSEDNTNTDDTQGGEQDATRPSDAGDQTDDGTASDDTTDGEENTNPPSGADQPQTPDHPAEDQPSGDTQTPQQPAGDQPAGDAQTPDQSSGDVQTPDQPSADTQTPDQPAQTPGVTPETPDNTTSPADSEEAPAEQPAETEEDQGDEPEDIEPIDFEGLMTIEELTNLDDETVEATMWESAPAPRRARAKGNFAASSYSFDVYYVNQEDTHDVTKTSNFNLKYQMEFHTSTNITAGNIEIRIPGKLLDKRASDGGSVEWSEIAVPAGQSVEEHTYNRRTPFNYYIADNGDIVFFNYRDIPAGTNSAWQVLYKNVTLMEIEDGAEWKLNPVVTVTIGEGEDQITETKEDYTALTGRIDSSVVLNSVTKIPYTRSGTNYTPGLYTVSQVKQFIDGEVPEAYLDANGRLDTNKYHFAVWEVKARGTATQPWNLSIIEDPATAEGVKGFVVGYKDHSNTSENYNLPIEEPVQMSPAEGTDPMAPPVYKEESSQNVRTEDWASRFYVVTAYPAEHADEGKVLENNITLTLDPIDQKDEDISKPATTAKWPYENYNWSYDGEMFSVTKKIPDDTRYTGWLDAYKKAAKPTNGETAADYGDLPYTTTANMYGYKLTHNIEGANLGQYQNGNYYTMITVDDVMYAHWVGPEGGKQHRMLGEDDYYFSGVTIEQSDYGYDVWEDKEIDSEWNTEEERGTLPEDIDNKVHIYAMFAATDSAAVNEAERKGLVSEEKNGWRELLQIDEEKLSLDDSGKMEPYELEQAYLDLHPYRIKVEHNTIDFRSRCKIDVKVRMRSNSPVMQEIINARGEAKDDEASPEIEIENLAGVMGTGYVAFNSSDGNSTVLPTNYGYNKNYGNYDGITGVRSLTSLRQELYGRTESTLPDYDSATRVVTWLTRTSRATKSSKTTNDVDNNRGLVEYMLTAYDGYDIYSKDSLDYLFEDKNMLSPGRTHVVFYDLLPYGMNFDASYPVTAGRITDLSNSKYTEQPSLWNKTQVSVTVTDKDIEPNYRGTGRTRVAFHIVYAGAETTSYTSGKWIEGWGLHFRAYYDWKDLDIVNDRYKDQAAFANSNICAFMPDFSDRAEGSNDGKWELYGLKGSVYHDNGEMPSGKEAVYGDLIKDGNIDGISPIATITEGEDTTEVEVDKEYANILYAYHPLDDEIAVASESKIETLVRADTEHLEAFSESAEVEVSSKDEEGNDKINYYTYDISVSAESNCQDIVIYNNLENGVADRIGDGDPFDPFAENWQGTLESIDLRGLTAEAGGVEPTVYFNSEFINITTGNSVEKLDLTADGWLTKEDWETKYPMADVKAIAIVMPDTFTLESGHSISFQVKMQALMETENTDYEAYAYNCASFYSQSTVNGTTSIIESNAARVGLTRKTETLEVIKKIAGDVPAARQGEQFSFYVYTLPYGPQGRKVPLSFAEYELFQLNSQNVWESKGTHGVDKDGYMKLTNGQKAVFTRPGASKVQVEEKKSVFWDVSVSKESKDTVTIQTVTNTFRPVLYVQKSLASVPTGTNLTQGQKTFTFQLKADGKPVANSEYWYVDRADLSGATPNQKEVIIDGKKTTTGKTDAHGIFTLRQGEIIALFPGNTGVTFELKELQFGEEADNGETITTGEDWICTSPTVTSTLPAKGFSKIFINYYKWKDLYVSKEITHLEKEDHDQLPVDEKKFTFQVFEAELNEDGTLKLDDKKEPIPVKRDDKLTTAGLKWELQLEESDTTKPQPILGDISGFLDDNGTFSCTLGFRTVKITGDGNNKGFEAKKIYIVKELTDCMPTGTQEPGKGQELYQAVVDADQVQMPISSSKEEATLTNDYLRRSMSVSKTVIFSEGARPDEEPVFDFIIQEVEGTEPARDYQYTILDAQGNVVPDKDKIYTNGGRFQLSDGQTAVFKDIGMPNDSFQVCEKVDANYQQIAPSVGGNTGTIDGYGEFSNVALSDGENTLSFINGQSGNLYISKEYVEEKEGGYVDQLKGIIKKAWWQETSMGTILNPGAGIVYDEESSKPYYLDLSKVKLTLKVTPEEEESFIWPSQDQADRGEDYIEVECINQLKGERTTIKWYVGQPIEIYPWVTLILPTEMFPSNATYTLQEEPEYQHRIERWKFKDGPKLAEGYLQFNQVVPADDQPVTGTVQKDAMARICNEVTSLPIEDYCHVYKEMTDYSDEVTTDAQPLVWKVEQYNEETKSWSPAGEIPYIVSSYKNGTNIEKNPKCDRIPVSDQIEYTGSDGKIRLEKTEDGYPMVSFTEDQVYLNLYRQRDIEDWLACRNENLVQGKLLRIVEIPEESDPAWGRLTGYDKAFDGKPELNKKPFLCPRRDEIEDLVREADTFVNSNKEETIAVKKALTEGAAQTDQQFTMILKQVVSMNPDTFWSDGDMPLQEYLAHKDTLTEMAKWLIDAATLEPRGKVPYTIHKPDGTTEDGVTTSKGEIKLRAGEYATLDLPQGTLWTVTEDTTSVPTYTLKDLTPGETESYAPLRWLDDNLMLINIQEPAPAPQSASYTVEWYDVEGRPIKGSEVRKGIVGQTVSVTEADKTVEGYTFWEGNTDNILSETLQESGTNLRLYFKKNLTLTYIDRGTQYDQVGCLYNDSVPIKNCMNTRLGYQFVGWSTDSNAVEAEYEVGEWFNITQDTTLYAVWQKQERASYKVLWLDKSTGRDFKSETRSNIVGTEVSVDDTDKTYPGYVFVEDHKENILSATLEESGTVLKMYFRKAGSGTPVSADSYTKAPPTRPSDGIYVYKFSEWFAPVEDANGNITYTAKYTSSLIQGEGTVIPTSSVGPIPQPSTKVVTDFNVSEK